MNRFLALLLLLASPAFAAGPIFWAGAHSTDATLDGLITNGLTISRDIPGNPAEYVAIDVHPTDASGVNQYWGLHEHPTFDAIDGDYHGVLIHPTLTGFGGDENAYGLEINMSDANVLGTKTALAVEGASVFAGGVSVSNSRTMEDATPVTDNAMTSTFAIPDSSTFTDSGGKALGLGDYVTVGAGASVTTYGVGGFTPFINTIDLNMGNGSSLDYANGSLVFASINGASEVGEVQNLTAYKAIVYDGSSGNTIVDKFKAFEFAVPLGGLGVESWGVYIADATSHNWFAGPVKIGGTADSTDRASSNTAGLQVENYVLLKSSSGAQPRALFTEDPDTGTDAIALQAPVSVSGSPVVTLPSISSTIIGSIALENGDTGTTACDAAFGGGGLGSCLGCKAAGLSAQVTCAVTQTVAQLYCACLGDIP